MVNFGPLVAEILSLVWGTPANSNGIRVLAGTPVLGISQTLRRWTEGGTYIRQGGHHVGHWPTFIFCTSFETLLIFNYVNANLNHNTNPNVNPNPNPTPTGYPNPNPNTNPKLLQSYNAFPMASSKLHSNQPGTDNDALRPPRGLRVAISVNLNCTKVL